MNNRIFSNTGLMFGRTVITMALSLYISRLVLAALGVTEFGIFALVTGAVAVISFSQSTLNQATQRFINFELGKSEVAKVQRVFATSFQLHLILGLGIAVVGSIIGPLFIEGAANLPSVSYSSALLTFYLVLLSSLLTFLSNPYTAAISASEHFSTFAAIDLGFAALRLLSALVLVQADAGRLELWATLLVVSNFIVATFKFFYCKQRFTFCRITPKIDRKLSKDIAKFAGWNSIGAMSLALNTQGLAIILNIAFGPVINAAYAIAMQAANAVSSVSTNLQLVASPQIVQSYSAKKRDHFLSMVESSSRISYLLVLTLTAPVFMEAEFLLNLWLEDPPDRSADIARLLFLASLFTSLSLPLVSAVQATGEMRRYQLTVGLAMLLNLPVCGIFLYFGAGPLAIFWVNIAFTIVGLCVRLTVLSQLINLEVKEFIASVIWPVAIVSAQVLCLGLILDAFIPNGFGWSILTLVSMAAFTLSLAWFYGLNRGERAAIISVIARVPR